MPPLFASRSGIPPDISKQIMGLASAAVSSHIGKLDSSIREAVQLLRETILSASPLVSEHIKWNNPAFYYNGPMEASDPKEYRRDLAVMNLHKNRIMLVFPSGNKIPDAGDLLTGNYPDGRRIVSFTGAADIISSKLRLVSLIRQWISLTA
ncbi:MAG: DUF1801 domain-containing protein [Chitinophagaceae bacterium]|nr:MAG: DUF1801 domain-containing protein [Chitinophagaceae bacterium]